MNALYPLTLSPVNAHVCHVLSAQGEHVGNLKQIGGVWKFKAIGYGADGGVIPGGGLLTTLHNSTFDVLDEALINHVLVLP